MTDTLTDLMHRRADDATFDPPDLAAVTGAGDRRLRRRRSLVALGGAAAAVVLAAAVVTLPGSERAAERDPATPPAGDAAPLTWVIGSTLHVGPDTTVDLGRDVDAYVRTEAGYVYVDPDGRVWSWEDGRSTDIGLTVTRNARLVADPETSTVAFVDGGEGSPQVVVFDQARGVFDVVPSEGRARLYSLDAGRVYWRDDRGIVAVDVTAQAVEVLDQGQAYLEVTDVETGVVASTNGQGSVVGDSPGAGVPLPEAYGSTGVLSPDGRFYSSEGDEQAVFDTGSGERVRLDLTQQFATGYEWLDETTLAVLAADRAEEDATAQLLTCTVPEGRCTMVAEDLGTFTDLEGTIALPVGEHTG